MSKNFIEAASKADFDKLISSNKFVFVDFFAHWCGPCKMVLPVVEEISNEMSDVVFVKVNVDNCPEVAAEFGISGIPRFIFFSSNEPVGDLTGARPKAQIVDFIEKMKKAQ